MARLGVSYTMAVQAGNVAISRAITEIPEGAWVSIEYPDEGEAQVAETTYKGQRLVVRRTRLVGAQATLWPAWRHFALLTDLGGTAVEVDAFHRRHATVELDIRDLKEGAGLEHCPSGNFWANGAWLACAVLAHNLVRWTQILGELHDVDTEGRPALRAHCAPATSRCLLASSTARGRPRCVHPHAGRGAVVHPRARHLAHPLLRAHLSDLRGPARPQTNSPTR